MIVSGGMKVIVRNNTFQDNFPPVTWLWSTGPYQNSPFKDIYPWSFASMDSYVGPTVATLDTTISQAFPSFPASPLLVRMVVGLTITSNNFSNNSQAIFMGTDDGVNTADPALYFASAITIDRLLGTKALDISSNIIQNYSGLYGKFPQSLSIVSSDPTIAKTSYHIQAWNQSYCLTPFVVVGFWPLFPSSSYKFGSSLSSWASGAIISLSNNIFSDSTFQSMTASNYTPSTYFSEYGAAIFRVAKYWEIIYGAVSSTSRGQVGSDWPISKSMYPFLSSSTFITVNIDSNEFSNLNVKDVRPLFLLDGEQTFSATLNTFTDIQLALIQNDDIKEYTAIFRQKVDTTDFTQINSRVYIVENTFSTSSLQENIGTLAIIEPNFDSSYTVSANFDKNYDLGVTFSNNSITNHSVQLALVSIYSRSLVNISGNTISNISQSFSGSIFSSVFSTLARSVPLGLISISSVSNTAATSSIVKENTIANVTTNSFSGLALSNCENIEISGIIKNVTFTIPSFSSVERSAVIRSSLCLAILGSSGVTVSSFTCSETNLVLHSQTSPTNSLTLSSCLTLSEIKKGSTITTNTISSFSCIDSSFDANDIALTDLDKHVSFGVFSIETSAAVSIELLTLENTKSLTTGSISDSTVALSDSTFSSCSAYSTASGLYISSGSVLTISSVLFEELSCIGCESTIWIEESTATVNDTEFTSNYCYNGAILYVKIAELTFRNVSIADSTCSTGSGIMYMIISTATFEDVTLTENIGYNAAIQMFSSTFTLRNSIISKNTGGGGSDNIELYDTTLYLSNCTYTGRYSDDSSYDYSEIEGAFIKAVRTDTYIQDSNFSSSAATRGGIIYYESDQSDQKLEIVNCIFSNSYAEYGGAIYFNGIISLTSSIFYDNTATQGSAIWSTTGSGTIDNVTAINNTHANFYFEVSGEIEIANSVITQTFGDTINTNGIQCLNCQSLKLNNVTISDMNSAVAGGAVRFEQLPYDTSTTLMLNIDASNFSFNQAPSGGGIYISAQIIAEILETIIANNSAVNTTANVEGNGGGIYYNCENYLCKLTIDSSTEITGNKAGVAGGAIKIVNQVPYNFDTTYPTMSYNSAPYGSDVAYYPVTFQQATSEEIETSPIKDILAELGYTSTSSGRILTESTTQQSGEAITPPIVFKILDEKGDLVTVDSSTSITVSTTSSSMTIRSSSEFSAINGYIALYPLNITVTPGQSFEFSLSSSDISAALTRYNRTALVSYSQVSFSYKYETKACERGQVISDGNVCSYCSSGSYYLEDPSQTSCTVCNESVTSTANCAGTYLLLPYPNYWRFNSYQESIISCLNTQACLGYSLNSSFAEENVTCKESYNSTICLTGYCAEGYEGNLCTKCSDGYVRGNFVTQTCVKCSDSWQYYLLNVVVFLLAMTLIVYSTKKALANYVMNLDLAERELDDHHFHEVEVVLKQPSIREPATSKDGIAVFGQIIQLNTENKEAEENRNNESVAIPSFLKESIFEDPDSQQRARSGKNSTKLEQHSPKQGEISLDVSLPSFLKEEEQVNTPKPIIIAEEETPKIAMNKEELQEGQLVNHSNGEKRLIDIDRFITEHFPKKSEAEKKKTHDSTNVYLKIIVTYFQLLSIVGELDFDWGDRIRQLFDFQETIKSSSTTAMSFDCLLFVGPMKDLDLSFYFKKLIIIAFVPFFALLLVMMGWLAVFLYWSRLKFFKQCKKYFKRYMTGVACSMIIFFYLMHPTVFQQSLYAFK